MKRWHVIILAVFAVLFVTWRLLHDNFHAVIPGEIYRSAQLSGSKLEQMIEEHGIRTVVSLRRPEKDSGWYRDEIATSQQLGVGHFDIDMDLTFSPRIDQLLELRDLLEDAPRPLLVHCDAGADRTGLASVMAKLLDGHSSLEEARAQVSWKYHAVRDDSIGIPFYNDYVAWLDRTGQAHNPEHFNQWLENDYLDLSGNIHFLVDPIRGQLWERPWGFYDEGHVFEVRRRDGLQLDLSGWAWDTRHEQLLDSVEVILGGISFDQVQYGIPQPWLVEPFGTGPWLDSGWAATHALDAWDNGCYDLTLRFTRRDGSHWTTPPAARICIS